MANETPIYGYPGTLSPLQQMLRGIDERVDRVESGVDEAARGAAREEIQSAIEGGDLASAAQGRLADSAVQPEALGALASKNSLTATEVGARPAGDVPWTEVSGKPAVIAAGADQAAARSAIGAGTSDLALGSTAQTAKPGNWVPDWTDVSGKPAVIAAGANAAAARAAIGAGTSNFQPSDIVYVPADEWPVNSPDPSKVYIPLPSGGSAPAATAPAKPAAPLLVSKNTDSITFSFVQPSDGGSAITAMRAYVNGSLALSNMLTSPQALLSLDPSTQYSIRISAVNAVGESAQSDALTVTTDAEAPGATAPAAFGSGDWSLADKETGGTLTVTITALPSDGGSAITGIEYRVGSGSWVSSGRTSTGSFDITGLLDDASASITLRAVNAVGAGSASEAKSETPTTAIPSGPLQVEFGELTPAGHGGYPVSATAISSGDPSGHWQIAGGKLSPSSIGAGELSGTYDLVLDDASEIEITVTASTRHVSSDSDMAAVGKANAALSGVTVKLRPGQYGEVSRYNDFSGLTDWCTITSDDPNNRAVIRNIRFNGPLLTGWIRLTGLDFFLPQDPNSHNFLGPGQPIGWPPAAIILPTGKCEVLGCRVRSDISGSANDVGLMHMMIGIQTSNTGDGTVIRDNEIYNIATGISVSGSNVLIENNDIHDIYVDFVNLSDLDGFTIRGNTLRNTIGWSLMHTDYVQGQGVFKNGVIEGNVMFPGDFMQNQRMWARRDAGAISVDIPSSMTLTVADHGGKVMSVSGTDVTLTLPPAASAKGVAFWFGVNPNKGPLYIEGASGDDYADGSFPITCLYDDSRRGSIALRSDGAKWRMLRLGLRAGYVEHFESYQCADHDDQKVFLIDASAGDVTITLPSPAGKNHMGFLRTDSSAHTVKVVPASGTISKRSVGVSEITIDNNFEAFSLYGGDSWTWYPGSIGHAQGIFSNNFAGTDNITTRGNIIYSNASHGLRIERLIPVEKHYNNTFLRTLHSDTNDDGVIDDLDGYFTTASSSPAVRMQGQGEYSINDRFMARTITTGDFVLDEGNEAAAHSQMNVSLKIKSPTNALSICKTAFAGDSVQDYYPTTRDEAIQGALVRTGGILDGLFIGATGTSKTNGFWDFDNNQESGLAPAIVIGVEPSVSKSLGGIIWFTGKAAASINLDDYFDNADSYSLSTSLPSGTSINGNTISGTPDEVVPEFNMTIYAHNDYGSASQVVPVKVVDEETADIPDFYGSGSGQILILYDPQEDGAISLDESNFVSTLRNVASPSGDYDATNPSQYDVTEAGGTLAFGQTASSRLNITPSFKMQSRHLLAAVKYASTGGRIISGTGNTTAVTLYNPPKIFVHGGGSNASASLSTLPGEWILVEYREQDGLATFWENGVKISSDPITVGTNFITTLGGNGGSAIPVTNIAKLAIVNISEDKDADDLEAAVLKIRDKWVYDFGLND